ncbi:MAG TPA: TonB-dependent receptor [Steroidobacteraceae bacterium]|nr:TonB-dependent receptor [Steroidobacteraceae bacterium]
MTRKRKGSRAGAPWPQHLASISAASLLVMAARPVWSKDAAVSAAPAGAQSEQPADPTAGNAQQSKAPSVSLQEVVVTGTLLREPNQVSPSPIVVTSAAQLRQSGQVDIESALNQLPDFTPAGTPATGGQGTGGHATVNLHGLGSNRNLVLLDGHRLPLADVSGDVDINLIPSSIISSVETITGGASAVYGSDAMSGVVNFKTIQSFEGVRADVQYGNSFSEDFRNVNASIAMGTKFDHDRGNLLVAVGYTYNPSLCGCDRGFFKYQTPSSYIGQGTFVPSANNLPNASVVRGLFAGYGIASPINISSPLGFNNDGTLFTETGAQNYRGPIGHYSGPWSFAILGGNVRMPVGPQGVILNSLDRHNVFSKFDYRIAPGLVAYGQVLYADWHVGTDSGGSLTQFGTPDTIPVSNPFIPADLATVLASRPDPTAPFVWNHRYVGLPTKSWDEHYTVDQFMGGLRGALPFGDWTWDAYTTWSNTDHVQSNYNAVLKSRVESLLSAPDGGASLCAGGFDPFGLENTTNISPACQQYMTTTAVSTETLSQGEEQILLQGSLLHLPAGPIQMALLADHRTNEYIYHPDEDLAAQNIEAVIASQPTKGAISVKEGATQIDVPVLRDLPGVKRLDIGGAFRFSDYDTSGGVSTYAGNFRWSPVDSLLVRGGYQRAVRAPAIGELYAAASGSQIVFGTPPVSIGDPCDIRSSARTGPGGAQVAALCEAQGVPGSIINSYEFPTTAAGGVSQGNPKLTPERANTFNFGLVWTSHADSPMLRRLSASVDFYEIEIQNVISVVPGLTTLSKCFNLDGSNPGYSPTNQFCQLLDRDPATGQLVLVHTPYENLGGLKTDGIDVQLNWAFDLADIHGLRVPGTLAIGSGIGYNRNEEVQTLPGTPWAEYSGTNTPNGSYPKWKALTSVAYSLGGATAGLRWRYQDAMADVTSVTSPKSPGIGVAPYNLYDFFAIYDISPTWQVRGGINNIFGHGIPVVSSSQNHTDAAVFDVIGRAYYVGVRLNLE